MLGRDEVIRRLVGVLGRRDRGNPLLVGESGVGKSAVLGGLAHALAPVRLLALTGPVADRAAFRAALADGAVVALDDLHTAVASDGSLPDLLAWLLADAGVRVVATVTPAGHRAWAERLPGLFRHFRPVPLDEPDLDATVAILRGLRPRYEEHHRLAIGDDALVAAAALAGRHVTAGFQPEKAIDLLDEAAARHRLGGGARPGAEAPPDLVAEALAGHAGLLRVLAEARQRRQAEAAKLAGLVERRRAQAEQARRAGDRAEEERLTGTVLPALERRLAATVQLTAGDVAEVVPAPPTSTLLLPGADELEPGDPRALGRYRIVRRIGAGGQGVVYLGEDASGGQVAIKVLRAEVTRSPQAHDRFQREVAAARRVASFCTAQVLESGFEGRRPYVVSEFVDGPSLREAIAVRGTRSGAALDRLAIGTITALAAIAEAGIVHRDFKPDNVLLAPDGPRVIDFGVARALDAASLTGQAIGTPAYMAPEQVRGGAVGPAADVYAWACTLVYAALGRPPHGADGVQQVMHRKLYGEPDLAGFAEAASAPLADLVVRSLARDPAARPTAERILFRLLGRDDPADGGLLAEGAAVATRVNE
ncbi:protein kinase domain-containing protein [Actinomadura macrotermitis]|uniref:Serine/threonine-protein kinase PknD n=1 Tax=Actinomadura macrotermitis TaxID=2585200 RepID=A0A7K0BUP7_9ACTN|nr:Serine/threonine-protein kinase PknD [Actinomadura macrotermitis]